MNIRIAKYDGLRYNFSKSLKIAVSERFFGGYKRASKIMNNEDIDKPLKMATLEQKRVSQIQGFVKIVPQKKIAQYLKNVPCDFL